MNLKSLLLFFFSGFIIDVVLNGIFCSAPVSSTFAFFDSVDPGFTVHQNQQ